MTDLTALGDAIRLVVAGRTGGALPAPIGSRAEAEGILRAAGDALLLPSLAPISALLPSDHAEIVAAAAFLNAERNRSILAQLEEVALALNAAGIVPCVIKGGCHLVSGLWGEPGARILGDLDLVVPPGTLARSRAALAALAEEVEADPLPAEVDAVQKHAAPLCAARWPAALELHGAVLERRDEALLPTAPLFTYAGPARIGAARIVLPSPTHQAMIAIIHGPVGHNSYFAPTIIGRDLVDLALLRWREGGAIDWDAIAGDLARGRWVSVTAITNHLVEEFCGEPGPFPEPRRSARLDARRWRWQLEHPSMIRVGRLAARSRYIWSMMRLGGEARRHYLAKLGQRATYRNAWENYVVGASGSGRQE